jgi:hypothetical protein
MIERKIIFVDDERERLNTLQVLCKEFNIVEYSCDVKDFFSIDKAGINLELSFSSDFCEYLFLHSSFSDPSLPSNLNTLIKGRLVKTKLMLFSGGSTSNLSSGLIKREDLYKNFYRFLKFHNDFGELFLPALVNDNYFNLYAKKLFEEIRLIDSLQDLLNDRYFQDILRLLEIEAVAFDKYKSADSLLNTIETKIEEL